MVFTVKVAGFWDLLIEKTVYGGIKKRIPADLYLHGAMSSANHRFLFFIYFQVAIEMIVFDAIIKSTKSDYTS